MNRDSVDDSVASGTWTVVRGTGDYAGVTGSGRSGHAGLGNVWNARYEGFLTTPQLLCKTVRRATRRTVRSSNVRLVCPGALFMFGLASGRRPSTASAAAWSRPGRDNTSYDFSPELG